MLFVQKKLDLIAAYSVTLVRKCLLNSVKAFVFTVVLNGCD
jgi:hypothetical protein